jgi:hypothetical protein
MKKLKYLFAIFLFLNTQIFFAKPLSGFSLFVIKDGVVLVLVLAIAAVLKIGQVLLSRE